MDLEPLAKVIEWGGGLAIIGGGLIKLTWDFDDLIAPERKREIGVLSKEFWTAEFNDLNVFKAMLDSLYKPGRLLRPSVVRFVVIWPVSVLVIAVLMLLIRPHFILNWRVLWEDVYGADFSALAIVFLFANLPFDYLSYWKSRWVIELAGSRWFSAPVVAFMDLVATIGLYFIAITVAATVLDLWTLLTYRVLYDSGSPIWLARMYLFDVIPRAMGVIFINPSIAGWSVAAFGVDVSVIVAFVPAIWTLLYAAGTVVLRLLTGALRVARPVINVFDFESRPLRINGTIVGVILLIGGLCGAFVRLVVHIVERAAA